MQRYTSILTVLLRNKNVRRLLSKEVEAVKPSTITINEYLDKVLKETNFLSFLPKLSALDFDYPTFNFYKTDTEYHIDMEVPGVEKKNMEVTYCEEENAITVNAKKETQESKDSKSFLQWSRSFGEFSRTINLPKDAEASMIKVRMADGILDICVPRSEKKEDTKPTKKIDIE